MKSSGWLGQTPSDLKFRSPRASIVISMLCPAFIEEFAAFAASAIDTNVEANVYALIVGLLVSKYNTIES